MDPGLATRRSCLKKSPVLQTRHSPDFEPSTSDEKPIHLVEDNHRFYFWAEEARKIMRIKGASGLKNIWDVLHGEERRLELGEIEKAPATWDPPSAK